MKIAIIAHGYSGATLPLAKHLADKGHEVDCYYLCWHGATQMESMEYGGKMSALSISHTISADNSLYNYLSRKVTVRIIPLFNPSNKYGKYRMVAQNAINDIHVNIIAHQIDTRQYDIVNVILYTKFDFQILRHLVDKEIKCCVSYHEVMTDLTRESSLLDVVAQANCLGTPIVVHSQKTKEDLLHYSDVKENRINIIHFGIFESFTQYGEGKPMKDIGCDYLLYLGFIKPYKGLKYLYEASQRLSHINDLKIVVAGGGYDPILDEMKKDNRFTVINRFIDNAELVYLMKHCKGIVCPYIGASQSGLVQTAMVFNKPVIATRVGAFCEIIKDNINGHLANPTDSVELARCIERLYCNTKSYDFSIPKFLDWDTITKQYLSLFQSVFKP